MTQSLLEAAALLKQFSIERRSWAAELTSRVDAVARDLAVANAPHLGTGKNASALEQDMVEDLLVQQKSVAYGIRALQDCKLLIVDAAASNPLQRLENVVLGAQSGDSVILRPGVYTTPIAVRRDDIVIKGGSGGQVTLRTMDPVSFLTMQAKSVSVKAVKIEQLGKIGSALVCVPPSQTGNTTPLTTNSAYANPRSGSLRPTSSFRAGSSGRWQPQAGTVAFEDCSFHSAGSAAVLIAGGSYRFERCVFSSPSNFGLRIRQQSSLRRAGSSPNLREARSDTFQPSSSLVAPAEGDDDVSTPSLKYRVDVTFQSCRFTNCRDGGIFVAGDDQVSLRIARCTFEHTDGSAIHLGPSCGASVELDDCSFVGFGVAGVMAERGNQSTVITNKCRFLNQCGTAPEEGSSITASSVNSCFVGVATVQGAEDSAE